MIENTKKNYYLKLALIVLAVAGFGLLLWKFDFDILFFIQDHIRNSVLDVIVPFYTSLGEDGIIWIVVGVAMLIPKKTRKCGATVLLTMAICYVVGNIGIKNLIQRPRPCSLDPAVQLLIAIPKEYSFPSGHTLHSFAAATSIFLQYRKPGIAALVLASVIAFSRMYLFVHFPTDILGGMILGIGMAILVYKITGRIRAKKCHIASVKFYSEIK